MSIHLQRDLDLLKRQVLAQSSLVEEMIQKASKAIRGIGPELVSEIMEREELVDENEVSIEESCLKILALHQPVARDLRRTAIVFKINNDLERMADLAVNIAERAQVLSAHHDFEIPETLDRMAQLTVAMVKRALDALVDLDVDIAREVCASDDEVDQLNREVIDEMQQVMRGQPHLIEAALSLFSASRHIERIADHATNIAEDVIYLVDGEIARHKHDLNPAVRS
jgi:phosphate transport system protein